MDRRYRSLDKAKSGPLEKGRFVRLMACPLDHFFSAAFPPPVLSVVDLAGKGHCLL